MEETITPSFEFGDGKIRWAFKTSDWTPTEQEWCYLLGHLEPTEKERIEKYPR